MRRIHDDTPGDNYPFWTPLPLVTKTFEPVAFGVAVLVLVVLIVLGHFGLLVGGI